MTAGKYVITGGASGIGAGIVKRLVARGDEVVILDNTAPKDAHPKVSWIEVDLANTEATRHAAQAALAALGGTLSGLIHCAAYQPFVPFAELAEETWQKTLAVNVTAAYVLSQELVPAMRTAGHGRIIVLTSSSFFRPPLGMVHYVTSKGALTGFVRAMAGEVGADNITVNAVAPGLTATESAVAHVPQELFDAVAQRQALKRTGHVSDQVGIVEFLLSPAADFITGQTILVDGGESHI